MQRFLDPGFVDLFRHKNDFNLIVLWKKSIKSNISFKIFICSLVFITHNFFVSSIYSQHLKLNLQIKKNFCKPQASKAKDFKYINIYKLKLKAQQTHKQSFISFSENDFGQNKIILNYNNLSGFIVLTNV